ncbi:MAG: CDP-glucose 4,6-dehydratase [Rhodocyclales bacterium]|nr:CDP-glucose 4,6-dehydratase [Rhodocyclales bacterium]
MIRSTYAGRRVLVTGHTGFKGSWLALWLKHLGAEVCGYALAPDTEPALYTLARVDHGIDSVYADVRDPATLRATLERFQPEIVFHLAAQSLVRASYRNPVDTYATNVMGTVHLLDALRGIDSVRAAVVVTSDKCYRNGDGDMPRAGFTETAPLGGADPYSSSKAATELVTEAWRHSFFPPDRIADHGVALASARAGNVIGGGDWAEDRLVPDMIRAFATGQPVAIRNPYAVRPWQHVLDPLWGYLLLAARMLHNGQDYARGWNFGPDAEDALTVAELATTFSGIWGGGARWQTEPDATLLPEAFTLRLDCRAARARLGWQPVLGLPGTLSETAEWYRAWAHGRDARQLCLEAIARHEVAIAPLANPPGNPIP